MTTLNTETGELVEQSFGSEIRARISDIRIIDRYRSDFGDIDGLAQSIKAVGLIQPIIVTPDMDLIAGERRLRAVESLGLDLIPARIVSNLDDAVLRLKAERDENTCRKEMTMSELVAIGKRLEELERPKAAARSAANSPYAPKGAGAPFGNASGAGAPKASERQRRTSAIVGEALGMSRDTYDRAKSVIDAIDDEDPEIAALATEAAKEMDASGKVRPAADKVRAARQPAAKPKAPHKHGGNRKKHAQILASIVTALEGLTIASDEITELDRWITSEEAARLADGLSKQIRSLNRIKTLLKEHSK